MSGPRPATRLASEPRRCSRRARDTVSRRRRRSTRWRSCSRSDPSAHSPRRRPSAPTSPCRCPRLASTISEALMSETFAAVLLGLVATLFLFVFWFSPGGVLALRRRAGELQPDVRLGYSAQTLYRVLEAYGEEG